MEEVPLVVYDDKGRRIVIGTAEVDLETNEVKTVVEDEEYKKLFDTTVMDYSIKATLNPLIARELIGFPNLHPAVNIKGLKWSPTGGHKNE